MLGGELISSVDFEQVSRNKVASCKVLRSMLNSASTRARALRPLFPQRRIGRKT